MMALDKLNKIKPFLVMEILERAEAIERAGEKVVHFEIGEPDYPTPEKIKLAAIEAIENNHTQYTHSLGLHSLREAICDHYRREYRVSISPERVIVTMGTSPGLLLALSCLAGRDDAVMLPNPGYACYESFIHYLEAEPVAIPVFEETGFQLSSTHLLKLKSPRTKALIINSPGNPTGSVLVPETLIEIANSGIPVISDEIYHGLVYAGRAHSILEYSDDAFVLNGFSKYFGMTGWRLGYVIVPERHIRNLQKMQQNFFISAANFVQHAGLAALIESHPELDNILGTYKKRRDLMIKLLRDIGFGVVVEPAGAFYVFANVKPFSQDSLRFAQELLDEAKVATAPGIDFGSQGEGFLRFSYATSSQNIREGIGRIKAYLASRKKG